MYTKRAEFTAGLVVLAGLAAMLSLLFVATGRGCWGSWNHWYVRFAQGDAAPVVDDDVVYLGLEIGRVKRVMQSSEVRSGDRLTAADRKHLAALPADAPQEVREVYVMAELELPATQVLPRGTYAKLQKNLVTGQPTLLLVPGFSREDLTAAETRTNPIRGSQGASLDDITGKVDALLEQVTVATKDVGAVVSEAKGFLEDLRKKLAALDTQALSDEALAAVRSLKKSLEVVEGRIDAISGNVLTATEDLKTLAATGKDTLAQAKTDLAAAMDDIKSAAAKVDEIVQAAAPKVDAALDEVISLAKQLSATAKDLEGLGPEAKRVVGEVGADLDRILAVILDASRNILDATEDLRAHPWKLANKPDADEIAFENVRLSMITYVRALREMQEASALLRELLGRPGVQDPALKAAIENALRQFQTSQERYQEAEQRFMKLLQQAGPKGPR
jgi:ABC-type transporter Mla subunit MlaD